MRTTILLLIVLSASALEAQQMSNRQTLAQQVTQYVRTVDEAAETFLNRRLPAVERLKAIEPHLVVYDEQQIEQFKKVAQNVDEPAEIRAAALDRIVSFIPNDERLRPLVLEWLVSTATPRPLRQAALRAEANLSFSEGSVPEVYQTLLDDPDLDVRIFAFTKLIIHGDPRAQQELIRGLENPELAPLPAPTALGILSMALKNEFGPAVYKVLLQTKDDATRLEAIRLLGTYPDAKKTLSAISRDANEKEPFREAALGALYAGDRDNIVQYVMPILSSGTAPARLQSLGIQMTMNVRRSMRLRVKAKKADAYDRLVARLARESADPAVRTAAGKYIESVRPKY